jgi:RND family efflux transporter MFP subunit
MHGGKTLPLWIVVWLCFALVACRGKEADDQRPAEGGSGRPAVAVETAPAATADLIDTIAVVGSLAPKFSADIKSQVTATVAEVFVTEWVPVKKGTPLARLDMREEQAGVEALEAALLQTRVVQTRARRELERAENLMRAGLITRQGLDDARTALAAAEAQTQAAAAQLSSARTRLSRALITAPFDGVIAFRGVSAGDRVENMGSTPPMFRIVDNRVLDLTVSVPSMKMARLRVGQPLDFSVDAFPDRQFTGEVMFINPSVDAANRTVQVIAQVRNPDGLLRGGLFAQGVIRTAVRSGVLQIPRAALLNVSADQQSADVFVLREERAELRQIGLGTGTGQWVEVAAGLSAGDAVVTRGGFNLRDGDTVTVVPSGK